MNQQRKVRSHEKPFLYVTKWEDSCAQRLFSVEKWELDASGKSTHRVGPGAENDPA